MVFSTLTVPADAQRHIPSPRLALSVSNPSPNAAKREVGRAGALRPRSNIIADGQLFLTPPGHTGLRVALDKGSKLSVCTLNWDGGGFHLSCCAECNEDGCASSPH